MTEEQFYKLDCLISEHIFGITSASLLRSVPKYSMITSEAMWVFEELRKSGKWCCLNISSDYNYVWDVILKQAEHQGNPEHKTTICVSSEKLPIAICLAALQAVGIDYKKELGL